MDNETIDILNREKFINDVIKDIRLLKSNGNTGFIMINGEWGVGKTFVLNMIKNKIKFEDYNIIEYNCWENSYYDDPLSAILSIMYDTIQDSKVWSDDDREKFNTLIEIPLYLLTFGTIPFFKVSKEILDKMKKNKNKTISSQIKDIKEYFNNNEKTIIVIVDELDRCLPEYAIKVLERLYLLFKDVKNIIVIIGNNNKQLEVSIKHLFGEIDASEYLNKFIDITHTLVNLEITSENLYQKYNQYFIKFNFNQEYLYETFYFLGNILHEVINPRTQKSIINQISMKHDLIFGSSHNVEGYYAVFEFLYKLISLRSLYRILRHIKDPINYSLPNKDYYGLLKDYISELHDKNYKIGKELSNPVLKGVQLFLFVKYHENNYTSTYTHTANIILRYFNNYIVNYDDKNDFLIKLNNSH